MITFLFYSLTIYLSLDYIIKFCEIFLVVSPSLSWLYQSKARIHSDEAVWPGESDLEISDIDRKNFKRGKEGASWQKKLNQRLMFLHGRNQKTEHRPAVFAVTRLRLSWPLHHQERKKSDAFAVKANLPSPATGRFAL
jgi:hypothetical protein